LRVEGLGVRVAVHGHMTKCVKPLRHIATSITSRPNGAFSLVEQND
jgi:hypothetical protein